ncbi:MAG: S1C family serine protease, partial [Acidimicrobiales bacterium]
SAAGGSVTALDQSITASDSGDGTTEQLKGLIETNAGIQPGDSGGPLVTPSGKVLGMDTAASAGFTLQPNGAASGVQAYSIPIDQALSIARQIERGTSSSVIHIGGTGFLGVEVESASSASSSGGLGGLGGFGGFGGSPQAPTSGALVVGVIPNTPAAAAGITQGDVITSFNGQSVTSASSLTNLIEPFHPGASVTVGWTNASGQAQSATVQLVSGPPQ